MPSHANEHRLRSPLPPYTTHHLHHLHHLTSPHPQNTFTMAININEDGDYVVLFDVLEGGTGAWPYEMAEVTIEEGDTTSSGVLGDWDLDAPLQLAVRRMKLGTVASVEYRQANGVATTRTIKVTSITNFPQPYELDLEGKINQACTFKETANTHLKNKEYERAEVWYTAGLRYADVALGLGTQEQERLKEAATAIRSNLSLVHLKRAEFRRAIEVLDALLEAPADAVLGRTSGGFGSGVPGSIRPISETPAPAATSASPKLLLRRATCYCNVAEFEKAEVDLAKVSDPSYADDVANLRTQLHIARSAANKKDKSTWGGVFGEDAKK